MSAPSPRKRHRKQRQMRRAAAAVPFTAPSPSNGLAGREGVFLACPSGDGNINFTIGMAFAWAMRANYEPGFPLAFIPHVEAGVKGIEYARNRIVAKFLSTDCSWLFMVDADQIVPQNFWQVMLVANADVVSGMTYTWMSNGPAHTMLRVNQYGVNGDNECFNLTPPPEAVALGSPYLVPVVGTGCVAIRRRVIERLGPRPFYFTRHEDGRIRGGEDINFSVDAQRAGFKLAVNPAVRFGHVKAIDVGQIATFYEARHGFDLQGRELAPAETLSVA